MYRSFTIRFLVSQTRIAQSYTIPWASDVIICFFIEQTLEVTLVLTIIVAIIMDDLRVREESFLKDLWIIVKKRVTY